MKTLELNQMEKLSGGQRFNDYEKCVLGTAASGATTGFLVGLAGGGVGAGPGLLGGWVFGAIGGMVGCAIMAQASAPMLEPSDFLLE